MEGLVIAKEFKAILKSFLQNLQSIYGNDLISVVLYGSAASGEFISTYSNLNLLIVLKNTDFGNLKMVLGIINKLSYRRINPLFLTEENIASSLDVFPIEFLDMKENYLCLFGKDILKDINIDTKNLRFQCEQELKSKLINLKQQYLRINQKDKTALINLLFKYFTSVIHILRNVVRLVKGEKPAYLKEDVLREIAVELHIDISILRKILTAKSNPVTLTLKEADDLLTNFVKELEKIIKVVDQL